MGAFRSPQASAEMESHSCEGPLRVEGGRPTSLGAPQGCSYQPASRGQAYRSCSCVLERFSFIESDDRKVHIFNI